MVRRDKRKRESSSGFCRGDRHLAFVVDEPKGDISAACLEVALAPLAASPETARAECAAHLSR